MGILSPGGSTNYMGCFESGGDYVQVRADAFSDKALAFDAIAPLANILGFSLAGSFNDLETLNTFRNSLPIEIRNATTCLGSYIAGRMSLKDSWFCIASNYVAMTQRPAVMDELAAAKSIQSQLGKLSNALNKAQNAYNKVVDKIAKIEQKIQEATNKLNLLKGNLGDFKNVTRLLTAVQVYWEQAQTMKNEAELLSQGRESGSTFFIACGSDSSVSSACRNQ